MSIKVTALDEQTGESSVCELNDNPQPGNYVLTCGPGTVLAHRRVHPTTGTEVLTLKAADDDAEVDP